MMVKCKDCAACSAETAFRDRPTAAVGAMGHVLIALYDARGDVAKTHAFILSGLCERHKKILVDSTAMVLGKSVS